MVRGVFIAAVLFTTSAFLNGQQEDLTKVGAAHGRTLAQLKEDLDLCDKAISEARLPYWSTRQTLLESWSVGELKTYLDSFPEWIYTNWKRLMIERWAFVNPEELIASFEASDAAIWKRYEFSHLRMARNGIERISLDQSERLGAMLSGWSRMDAVAAWEAVIRPNGRLSELFLLSDSSYGYLALIEMSENLTRLDPALAWREFENFPDKKHREIYRESMMMGISEGLPDGSNWKEVLEKAFELAGSDSWRLAMVIRGQLLARWLEHDSAAAVEWYRSKRAEKISISEKEVS